VQDIQGGGSTTVTDDGNGNFTVTSTGGSGTDPEWADVQNKPTEFPPSFHTHPISEVVDLQSELDDKLEDAPSNGSQYAREDGAWSVVAPSGADAELTFGITITDPVGPDQTVGQTYTIGTDLETIIRDMLVSYQVPDVSNITNPNPGQYEHGLNLSFSLAAFSLANPANINTGVQGSVNFITPSFDSNDVSQSFTYTGATSQSVVINASAPALVASTNAGASGTAKSQSGYKLQVTGTNSLSNSFERTEPWSVRFRTYFGASTSATIPPIGDLTLSTLSTNSDKTWTVPAESNQSGFYTWFAMPTCHWDDISTIIWNGSVTIYHEVLAPAAWAVQIVGTSQVNGVEYKFVRSNASQAFAGSTPMEVNA
jgi:hypothetical protein